MYFFWYTIFGDIKDEKVKRKVKQKKGVRTKIGGEVKKRRQVENDENNRCVYVYVYVICDLNLKRKKTRFSPKT